MSKFDPFYEWNGLLLPARAINALEARYGGDQIRTVDELCRHSRRDLLLIKNMGEKMVAVIVSELERVGRKLGDCERARCPHCGFRFQPHPKKYESATAKQKAYRDRLKDR
jgi:predicted Zn-ribbon and HTH transcriptional regulator